jgi:putative transposase
LSILNHIIFNKPFSFENNTDFTNHNNLKLDIADFVNHAVSFDRFNNNKKKFKINSHLSTDLISDNITHKDSHIIDELYSVDHNSISNVTNDIPISIDNKVPVDKNFDKLYKNIIKFNNSDLITDNINTVQHKYNLIKSIKRCLSLYNKAFPPSIHSTFNSKYLLLIAKDIKNVPFWNDEIKEKSRELFLPIDEFMEPEITSFTKNTWFNTEFKKEKYPCFHLSELNYIPENEIKNITKTIKIKLFFTKKQAEVMKRLLSAHRYYYNRTIEVLNNYDKISRTTYYYINPTDDKTICFIKVPLDTTFYNFYYLRSVLKTNEPQWIIDLDCQERIKDLAINEAIDNISTNFKKHNKFTMKMKTKKDLRQTIRFEKESIHHDSIMPNFNYKGEYTFRKLKMSQNIKKYNYGGSSITYERILGTFTLNLSCKFKSKANTSTKICALDLGVREFVVSYSDSKVAKFGIKSTDRLFKVCKEIDIIDSRLNRKTYHTKDKKTGIKKEYKVTSKRKRQLRKAKHRKIRKLENLKKELHDQTINYICKNNSKIIIPPFETKNMVSNKKLKSITARNMYNLSFYEFREKLKQKAKERNCVVSIRSEAYTSMTCTRCGNLKHELKMRDEIYKCKKCNLTIDRNYSAARNILLRNN